MTVCPLPLYSIVLWIDCELSRVAFDDEIETDILAMVDSTLL